MKTLADAIAASKGGADSRLRVIINNAGIDSLNANPNSLLAQQTKAWAKMSLAVRVDGLKKELQDRLPKLKDHHIDGILANFYCEGGLHTAIQNRATVPFQKMNSGSGSIGFAQWLGPRHKAVLYSASKYAALKQQEPDLHVMYHPVAQIDTVIWELENTHKIALSKLLSSKSSEAAVASWLRYYEGITASDISAHGPTYSPEYRVNKFNSDVKKYL